MQNKSFLLAALAVSAGLLPACGRAILAIPDGAVCDGDVCTVSNGDARDSGTGDISNRPDGEGTDVVIDTRVPRCGDSVLDPGETCDDNNNANGDGCNSMCRWEARCGDNRVDPGEICDDGNNRSGDGCRSDCRSNETCGNGIVDTVRGELCDGTLNCAADCRSITTCGNGVIEAGEECDDRNTTRWDGCAPDCRVEQGVGLEAFFILPDTGRDGCDFSGDRRIDNAFGHALGNAAGILNTAITNGISNGQLLLQLGFLAMNDRLGVADDDLRVGWLNGLDGDTDTANNRDPGNPQRVNSASLNMLGLPQANYQGAIAMSHLEGGPEDIVLNLPGPMGMPFNFRVTRSHISGTLLHDAMHVTSVGTLMDGTNDGTLCGAIPALDLSRLPNFFALVGGMGGGGGGGPRSSFLEAVVGGHRIMIPLLGALQIGPQQPDIDLDGDGLERYEATAGNNTTAPMITACIDGDGTRVVGRDCADNPRFADGFTAAFRMYGPWIRFVGTGSGMGGGSDAGMGGGTDAGTAPRDGSGG